MAHQITREQIDQYAAAQAAQIPQPEPPAPADTVLAYGATGECVTRLVDLLAATGHLTRSPLQITSVDQLLLADVAAAQAALGVSEPEFMAPDQLPGGVKGTLVGQATWDALYAAAAEAMHQQQIQQETATAAPSTAASDPTAA